MALPPGGLGNGMAPAILIPRLWSKTGEQSEQREVESDGDQFQVDQRHVAMASLNIGQITAVQSEPFRQLDLRPATLLPQSAEPSPKPNANVFSHVSRHHGVLLMDYKATLSNNALWVVVPWLPQGTPYADVRP